MPVYVWYLWKHLVKLAIMVRLWHSPLYEVLNSICNRFDMWWIKYADCNANCDPPPTPLIFHDYDSIIYCKISLIWFLLAHGLMKFLGCCPWLCFCQGVMSKQNKSLPINTYASAATIISSSASLSLKK